MSSFDTIGSLLGKTDNSPTSVPEALVAALGNHEGGLAALVQKFEGAGLGDVISSWVGTGQNQAVAPDALHGILGARSSGRFQRRPGCRLTNCCHRSHSICPGWSTV
jgi:uncharacterized protein YidB (DUF937 family)